MSQSQGTQVITLSQPNGQTIEALASEDPTQSTGRRKRFKRRFSSRWQTVRGAVRSLIQGDRHYKPSSSSRRMDADSAQIADFREWLETALDEELVEPAAHRGVRRGRHFSAPFVRDLYIHGIRQADKSLKRAGWEFQAPDPEAAVNYDPHKDVLAQQYVETYQDVVDAARAAERDATRAYRDAVHRTASASETISDVNDRLDKVGRYRTDLVAESKSVITINTAALTRYEQVGAEEVGVEIELVPEDEDPLSHACTHATVEALQFTDRTQPAPGEEGFQLWDTAGDLRVCDECASLGGSVYRIEEIRSGDAPMPVRNTHPRCRCYFIIYQPS